MRSEAVGGAHAEPGRRLAHQPGDTHHEELVEHGREDRAELHPLEERHRVVARQVEDALARIEPRELAVEESALRRSVSLRHHAHHHAAATATSWLRCGERPGAVSGGKPLGVRLDPREVHGLPGAEVRDDRLLVTRTGKQRLPAVDMLRQVRVAASDHG